jgi:hypothetical protein
LPGTVSDFVYLAPPAPVLRATPAVTSEPEGEAALVAAANRAVAEAYAALCEAEIILREVGDAVELAKCSIEDWSESPQPSPK